MLILGENHLYRVTKEYVEFFNQARPHQGIAQKIPEGNRSDVEAKQRLLNLILQRVWVCDDHLCAIMLRPSYYVSVHQALKDGMIKDIPQDQLPPFLQKENGNFRVMESCRCGSDGHPALITILELLVAPVTLLTTPFKDCVRDCSISVN